MYCKYCGGQVRDDAKFCNKCGGKLVEEKKAAQIVLPESLSGISRSIKPFLIFVLVLQLICVYLAVGSSPFDVTVVETESEYDYYDYEYHDAGSIGAFSDWSEVKHELKEYDCTLLNNTGTIRAISILYIVLCVACIYLAIKKKNALLSSILMSILHTAYLVGLFELIDQCLIDNYKYGRYRNYSIRLEGNSTLYIASTIISIAFLMSIIQYSSYIKSDTAKCPRCHFSIMKSYSSCCYCGVTLTPYSESEPISPATKKEIKKTGYSVKGGTLRYIFYMFGLILSIVLIGVTLTRELLRDNDYVLDSSEKALVETIQIITLCGGGGLLFIGILLYIIAVFMTHAHTISRKKAVADLQVMFGWLGVISAVIGVICVIFIGMFGSVHDRFGFIVYEFSVIVGISWVPALILFFGKSNQKKLKELYNFAK